MRDIQNMSNEEKLQEAEQIINDGNGILRPYHVSAQFEKQGVDYARLLPPPADRGRCCAFCERLYRPARVFGRYYCQAHKVYFGEVTTRGVSESEDWSAAQQAVDGLITALALTEEFVCNTHFEPRSW